MPRYRYAGLLTGEDNFKIQEAQDQDKTGRLRRGLMWALGAFDDSVNPNPLYLGRPQSGMVASDGTIYVTDAARAAVFVFEEFVDDLGGRMQIWELARPAQRFLSPVAVAEGPKTIKIEKDKKLETPEILVTDADLKIVVRLSNKGEPLGVIGEGLLKRPTGLVRDPKRKLIYVADTMAHDIKVFDDDGTLVDTIGNRERGESSGWLNMPTHLAIANGQLYVSDTMNARIQVFDLEGGFVKTFGNRGLFVGEMVRPKGVAVDNEGNIYSIESYYDHLNIYDKDGQLLLPIGGTGEGIGMFYLPAGVWVDNRNRVFVADMFNGRVVILQFLGGDDG